MKILFIDVNCKISSTGKIVYDLFTECRKEGHEAAICYGRGTKIDEQNILKFGLDIETYFHAFMTRLTGLTGCYSFFSTRRLLKFMEEFKPDVVHIHELHAYFVNLFPVTDYLKKKNIKTVWTFHCEFMYTGKCGYAYECEKWKTECGRCPKLRDYPSSMIFDFTKRMYRDKQKLFKDFNNLTIVSPSQWLADRIKQSFLSDKRINVIHNGIDIRNVFYPRQFDHLKVKHNIKDEKIVLAVAPDLMSERKGGRHILDLAKRMKNENVKFILIGVEDLDKNFNDNVIALERIGNQQELAEYYSMANVFIICSLKETFSQTCAESLCCGTPVVGFESGAPETVFDKLYATFVPYCDLDSLQEAAQNILNGKNISNECANYGKDAFSKDKMYEEYMNLYKYTIE